MDGSKCEAVDHYGDPVTGEFQLKDLEPFLAPLRERARR
jgi:hypothetical protein